MRCVFASSCARLRGAGSKHPLPAARLRRPRCSGGPLAGSLALPALDPREELPRPVLVRRSHGVRDLADPFVDRRFDLLATAVVPLRQAHVLHPLELAPPTSLAYALAWRPLLPAGSRLRFAAPPGLVLESRQL